MLLKIIQRSFLNQKKAMALMIVSVAVGTALTASLINISLEIGGKVSKELRSFGANILVEPKVEGLADISGQKRYLRQDDIVRAKTIFWRHNILGMAPFLDAKAEIKIGSKAVQVDVAGMWYEKQLPLPGEKETFLVGTNTVFPWWHINGKWPVASGTVAVGSTVSERLGIAKGDTLRLDGDDFIVSGIFDTGGVEDTRMFMDLYSLQKLKDMRNKVSRVLVSAITKPMDEFAYRDPESMSQAEHEKWYCTGYVTTIASQLEEVFAGANAKPVWKIADTEGRVLGRLNLLIYLLTFIVLIAAVLGVSATMIMSLLRRVQEIGLMKAVGADSGKILIIFLSEGVMVGLVGGLVGYALSFAMTEYIGVMVFNTAFEHGTMLFPLSLGSAVVISVAGTVLPLRKALRIRPGVVMKGAE
jgi:putative ABC transport system permease protein